MAHPIEGHPIQGLGSVDGHIFGRRGSLALRYHSHDRQGGVEDQIRSKGTARRSYGTNDKKKYSSR